MDLQVTVNYVLRMTRDSRERVEVLTDRAGKLHLEATSKSVHAMELLEDAEKECSLVVLEVEKEARSIHRVYHPIIDVIAVLDEDEHAEGGIRVQALRLPTLLTLGKNAPDHDSMCVVLRDAYRSQDEIAVAVRPGDHEILDVRAPAKPKRKSGEHMEAPAFHFHVPVERRSRSVVTLASSVLVSTLVSALTSAVYAVLQTSLARTVKDSLQGMLGRGRSRR